MADWVRSAVFLTEVTRICLWLSASQEAALGKSSGESKATSAPVRTADVKVNLESLSHPGDSRFHTCLGEHSEKGEVSLELRTGEEHMRARDVTFEKISGSQPVSWDTYSLNQKRREETRQETEGREHRRKGGVHHQA